ncbi:hypothetical protein VTK56DRAFT_9510 [Thermocarpiscus australiensis]
MPTALPLCLMALAGLFPVATASRVPLSGGGLGSLEMPSVVLQRDAQAGGTFVLDNGLTMDEFVDMNPSVDTDCYSWVGGREYCIMMPRARYISTDRTCRRSGTITCIGSAFGPCCGKDGRCSSTERASNLPRRHFSYGDGQCPSLGYSTNGTCGRIIGLRCGGPFGSCCSNSGVCGSTEKECGVGNCQSGACVGSTSTSSTAPATTSSQPSVVPFRPSPDGTCGGALKYKCTGTDSGNVVTDLGVKPNLACVTR